jgi:methylase of polypeptide subunit release factors
MTGPEFIAKWRNVTLTERSAAQQHFLDLCDLVGHPKPADLDKTGDTFTFERGAAKHGGGDGWADVWKKAFFACEYKGRHKNLDAAYDQLLQTRDSLENPPLLMTCDLERIVIHTNFTATPVVVYEIRLEDLATPEGLDRLHSMFFNPEALRPGTTCAAITAKAAGRLADLAQALRNRGLDPRQVAHFLDRIVFCLFAEDIGLLPEGVFSELLQRTRAKPDLFRRCLADLFGAMAGGGDFALREIRHFNGSLLDSAAVLELTEDELRQVREVAQLDWSAIDPSIFGTLFVRGMDPALRSQLGAEFTGREDIETLVEPVVMVPLRREEAALRTAVDALLPPAPGGRGVAPGMAPLKLRKAKIEGTILVRRFLERLATLKVLDPACGSGNFLYVVLQKLKDLEKEVIVFAQDRLQASFLPTVGPWQLYGIEVNPYAHDLAQMTVWIGYLQWTRANGFNVPQYPVLKPLPDNFLCLDAILDLSDPTHPREPDWPAVDAIVGNPPFLGGKLLRRELGDAYVDRLFALWADRVPREADLCCYWFEKARAHLANGACRRAGLLATQGIRGGANRRVLERLKESGDIFFAESDRPWVLDGANVHVSMVAFDDGSETHRVLDGRLAPSINANLTSTANLGSAVRLPANTGLAFMGTTKQGSFDLAGAAARSWLALPNPHGRPNSDVLFPWLNGQDVTRRPAGKWIIDFGTRGPEAATLYQTPFEHLIRHVQAFREAAPRAWYRDEWWQLYASRPEMQRALHGQARFAATPRVAKHRLFVWLDAVVKPDCQLIVFPCADDYVFGVLHSRLHETWALKLGSRLETRPRYTPTSCFETFPFPWTPGQESASEPLVQAIGGAAAELCRRRDAWLNPPEWVREEMLEFPATVGGPWDRFIVNPRRAPETPTDVHEPDATAVEFGLAERAVALARREALCVRTVGPGDVGLARYPRLLPRSAECAEILAKRTLTNLYNQRPAWLDLAHRHLDEAVCAAYRAARGGDWSADLPAEKILEQLLALNLADGNTSAPAC